MEQSLWLIQCNHSDEMRTLGRVGGERQEGSCWLAGWRGRLTQKRQQ